MRSSRFSVFSTGAHNNRPFVNDSMSQLYTHTIFLARLQGQGDRREGLRRQTRRLRHPRDCRPQLQLIHERVRSDDVSLRKRPTLRQYQTSRGRARIPHPPRRSRAAKHIHSVATRRTRSVRPTRWTRMHTYRNIFISHECRRHSASLHKSLATPANCGRQIAIPPFAAKIISSDNGFIFLYSGFRILILIAPFPRRFKWYNPCDAFIGAFFHLRGKKQHNRKEAGVRLEP